MLVPWLGIKYTTRGKVMASPKSGPWWVLWVRGRTWLVLAPKVFQLCINQLVIWFCVGACEWLILVIFPSPHLGTLTRPFTLKVLQARELAPTFYFSVVFTLHSHLSLSRSLGKHHKPLIANMIKHNPLHPHYNGWQQWYFFLWTFFAQFYFWAKLNYSHPT